MELLRCTGTLAPGDAKTYRQYRFVVPSEAGEIEIHFEYDPGRPSPHSLVTLTVFDGHGFRGAGHRFRPQQVIRIGTSAATPGFLPGPLPAGEWTVELDLFWVSARLDGEPNRYALAVEARPAPAGNAASPPPRRRIERQAAAEPRWYRGELHLHTDHSDASWTAAELAEGLRRRGADFAVLTDHNTVSGLAEMLAQETEALLVIPGMELTTFSGHALAIGTECWHDWRVGMDGRTINDAARDVRGAGALFIVAHPDAPPDEECAGCRWAHRDLDPALAHAVEVWGGRWDDPEAGNPGCVAQWWAWLNQGHRLGAIGATDAHGYQSWEGATPMTFAYATALGARAIVEAIRRGHTYVSSGPALELCGLGERGCQVLTGESLPAQPLPQLQVAWNACPNALLRLVANGEVRHVRHVQGQGQVTLSAYPGDRWYSAELWDERGDIMLAVTSPIYLE